MAFWIKKKTKKNKIKRTRKKLLEYIHTYVHSNQINYKRFYFHEIPKQTRASVEIYRTERDRKMVRIFFASLHFILPIFFWVILLKKTEKKNNNNDRLKKRKQNFLWIGFPILKVSVLWLWPIEFYLATSSIKNLTTLSNT